MKKGPYVFIRFPTIFEDVILPIYGSSQTNARKSRN